MRQKNYLRSTIVSTLVIMGLFAFCYWYFIRPMYLNNVDQQKTISLQKTQKIAFGKYPEQKKVFGIELEISGSASSNVDIVISDEKGMHHSAALKGKKLDFVYKNNWTSDSCFIEVLPRGKKHGTVNVNCRFLAID